MKFIRLLPKPHLLAKIALFGIFTAKFLGHLYSHALKILPQICSKIANFFKQSEFRKKSIRLYSLLLFLFCTAEATEHNPWFFSLFEFQGKGAYLFEKVRNVQTPHGNFNAPTDNSSVQLSMNATPWPCWNVEAEIFLTQTHHISFTYEAALLSLRYAWLDDICGDWITLVTGTTLSFPSSRFLREFSFDYHGTVNAEFHVTMGKEWVRKDDWVFRMWGLAGYGIANRGSPWTHYLGMVEYKPLFCLETGFFSEAVYGLGKRDINPHIPFQGYASINHQSINIGGYLTYQPNYFSSLTLLGWYNVHAHNFISHYWGAGISFLITFSAFELIS